MANYVENAELYKELSKLHRTGVHSEKLHLMLYMIAERNSLLPRFSSYTWIDDMVSDAYLKCLNVAHKFKLHKKNPFSYFTTGVRNYFWDFLKRIYFL